MTKLPSPEILAQLIRYEPLTGKLFWKERPREMFERDRDWRWWNGRYSGRETGTPLADGYLQVKIFDQGIHAHRIAWALTYGVWVPLVDHRNGRRGDNRLKNLRACSRVSNARNQKLHRSNTSGHVGVTWCKHYKKWMAQISTNGRSSNLGYFTNKDDAIARRVAEQKRLRFSSRHGKQ